MIAMNRMERRRKITTDELIMAKKIAFHMGEKWAVECAYASMLLIMHDKFDFTPEQCKHFLEEVDLQFGCVVSGHVSYDDIKQTILDELNIDIREYVGSNDGDKNVG